MLFPAGKEMEAKPAAKVCEASRPKSERDPLIHKATENNQTLNELVFRAGNLAHAHHNQTAGTQYFYPRMRSELHDARVQTDPYTAAFPFIMVYKCSATASRY